MPDNILAIKEKLVKLGLSLAPATNWYQGTWTPSKAASVLGSHALLLGVPNGQ